MKYILILILGFTPLIIASAQFSPDIYKEEWSFRSNNDQSIKVVVEESFGKFTVYAINNSFYPYTVNIELDLKNLRAETYWNTDIVVNPGRRKITDLTIVDSNQGYSHSLAYHYQLGDINTKHNDSILYLIPLEQGRKVRPYPMANSLFSSIFAAQEGDTVYASRMGIVCNAPLPLDEFGNENHISITGNNLEIIQPDGTIAVYRGIDFNKCFVKCGETIFPGTPIGIVSETYISIMVYTFKTKGLCSRREIRFSTGNGTDYIESDNEYIITHPEEVIFKEMTKRQIKKYKKLKNNSKTL